MSRRSTRSTNSRRGDSILEAGGFGELVVEPADSFGIEELFGREDSTRDGRGRRIDEAAESPGPEEDLDAVRSAGIDAKLERLLPDADDRGLRHRLSVDSVGPRQSYHEGCPRSREKGLRRSPSSDDGGIARDMGSKRGHGAESVPMPQRGAARSLARRLQDLHRKKLSIFTRGGARYRQSASSSETRSNSASRRENASTTAGSKCSPLSRLMIREQSSCG